MSASGPPRPRGGERAVGCGHARRVRTSFALVLREPRLPQAPPPGSPAPSVTASSRLGSRPSPCFPRARPRPPRRSLPASRSCSRSPSSDRSPASCSTGGPVGGPRHHQPHPHHTPRRPGRPARQRPCQTPSSSACPCSPSPGTGSSPGLLAPHVGACLLVPANGLAPTLGTICYVIGTGVGAGGKWAPSVGPGQPCTGAAFAAGRLPWLGPT